MMAGTQRIAGVSLRSLLADQVDAHLVPDMSVAGLAMDSREITAGEVFLACAGTAQHGMAHGKQAAERGALAILAEISDEWNEARLQQAAQSIGVPVIPLAGLSARVSGIAAAFYGWPGEAMRVIGITGTNGKTSVSHFLSRALDIPCGQMGTLGYGLPGKLQPASHTTPDPVRVQAVLAELRDAGARAVAMEVSSHALHQHRVAAVPFHTAIFTNLSRDHLDYHGDMASYGEVKGGLFRRPGLKLAVLNGDDPLGLQLARELAGRTAVVLCASHSNELCCDARYVCGEAVQLSPAGLSFRVNSSWGRATIRSRLLGRFNVDNLLLVLATLLGWGMQLEKAVARLAGLATVPGRMQAFSGEGRPVMVVDYAHTPDALENALTSLREHRPARLHCVFGCGGERDQGKRPLMGAVAERLSDRVILTDDNPRGEDGATIIDAIRAGMARPDQVRVERNRAAAIRLALAGAGPDDIVLVAGKGHETYQQLGDLKQPFSDIEQVQAALAEVST